MALTFRLYALARKRLEEMLQNLSSQELYYIGGPDPLPSPLSHEEELALVARLPEDDGTVRATLIERNLRLVVFIARKFENTGIALEDLGEGMDFKTYKEDQYRLLAEGLRASLDMEAVYRIIGEGL